MKQKFSRLSGLLSAAAPRAALFVTGLLLSRAEGIGGARPFGFAFFAACGGDPFAAAGAALGLVLSGADLLTVGGFVFSAAVFMAVFPGIRKGRLPFVAKRQSASLAAIIVPAVGLFLLFISMSVGGYPLLYDCIVLLAESATVFVSAVAFGKALSLLPSLHLRRTLTGEETLCMALLFGCCVSGLCGIRLFGSLDIGETLCVFLVMIYAIRFGSLHGGAAGAVMGLICALSRGRIDASPASFAVSGIAAGCLNKKGKIASCTAFILSNALVTALANGSAEVLINLSCSLAAALLIFLVPRRFFEVIDTVGAVASAEDVLLRDRLRLLGAALSNAEAAMRALSPSAEETEKQLSENMRGRAARRICSRCGLKKYCWGRDGKNTDEAMNAIAQALESGKKPSAELAPPHCIRPEIFAAEFAKMHELYLCDLSWSGRRRELQSAMLAGFDGIKAAAEKLADGGGEAALCDELLADDIRSRLRRLGIDAWDIFVTGSHEDTEVRLALRSCGELGCCEEIVPAVLEQATGLKFAKTGLKDCNSCRCRYVVAPEYDIEAAVASAVKENRRVSGDYSACCLLGRTTFVMALCDGCGSGEKAARESRFCARLLISLLEAGMDAEAAINLTNSIIIGSGIDGFTAIDLCIAELGRSARLYKCGGAATYLRKSGEAEEISAGGLPAGVSPTGGAECYERSMDDESTLVLISDGVALSGDGSDWIKELIEHGKLAAPQRLASEILNRARDSSGGVPRDDLTVIAANIRRKQA